MIRGIGALFILLALIQLLVINFLKYCISVPSDTIILVFVKQKVFLLIKVKHYDKARTC